MAQLINQFSQAPVKGQMDLRFNPAVVSCQVDSGSADLVAGDAVKIVNTAGSVPLVTKVIADTDDTFGFVAYNIKNASFTALDYVEIAALRDNVIYLEAGAAVSRWAKVMWQVSGSKVITAAGPTKVVIGRAYDKAAADGDLIRVFIDLPGQVLADSLFSQAANVAANAGSAASHIALSTAGGNTYSDTAVNTAVNAAIDQINTYLGTLKTTLNAEIAALIAANLQSA